MAADFTIHIRTEDVTDKLMRDKGSHTMGSKYLDLSGDFEELKPTLADVRKYPQWKHLEEDFDPKTGKILPGKYVVDLYYIVMSSTPQIVVGEVSWLKAAIFEDGSRDYVPDPIQAIAEIFWDEDGIEITDSVIARVQAAFTIPNQTHYSLANGEDILNFLKAYKGERAFTMSW